MKYIHLRDSHSLWVTIESTWLSQGAGLRDCQIPDWGTYCACTVGQWMAGNKNRPYTAEPVYEPFIFVLSLLLNPWQTSSLCDIKCHDLISGLWWHWAARLAVWSERWHSPPWGNTTPWQPSHLADPGPKCARGYGISNVTHMSHIDLFALCLPLKFLLDERSLPFKEDCPVFSFLKVALSPHSDRLMIALLWFFYPTDAAAGWTSWWWLS